MTICKFCLVYESFGHILLKKIFLNCKSLQKEFTRISRVFLESFYILGWLHEQKLYENNLFYKIKSIISLIFVESERFVMIVGEDASINEGESCFPYVHTYVPDSCVNTRSLPTIITIKSHRNF